ncbi:MAG: sugar ABC transporter permease, partial [Phycisphaerae bacterium]|nr:sugar ABC transporter permease [Phycisphaerae bacterium]
MMKFALWHGRRERRNTLAAWAFLAPNFLGFLFLTAGPVFLSLFMSFTNWNLKPAVELQWIGLRNYKDLLSDRYFWFYLYNTFYFMLGIPFSVAGSLFLANTLAGKMQLRRRRHRYLLASLLAVAGLFTCLVLFGGGNRDAALLLAVLYLAGVCGLLWGSMTYRTMFYVPSFAAGVATIVLWTHVYNPHYGLANNLLRGVYDLFGVDAELPTWLASTKSLLGFLPFPEHFSNGGFGLGAREAIMIMTIWMAVGGNNMILYIAAISNIPEDLYEAAEIDGAGGLGKFWHITLPQVAPTTFFISVMAVIYGIQGGFNFVRVAPPVARRRPHRSGRA